MKSQKLFREVVPNGSISVLHSPVWILQQFHIFQVISHHHAFNIGCLPPPPYQAIRVAAKSYKWRWNQTTKQASAWSGCPVTCIVSTPGIIMSSLFMINFLGCLQRAMTRFLAWRGDVGVGPPENCQPQADLLDNAGHAWGPKIIKSLGTPTTPRHRPYFIFFLLICGSPYLVTFLKRKKNWLPSIRDKSTIACRRSSPILISSTRHIFDNQPPPWEPCISSPAPVAYVFSNCLPPSLPARFHLFHAAAHLLRLTHLSRPWVSCRQNQNF